MIATIFDSALLLLDGDMYERSKIDVSTHEMKILFQEKLPYQTGDTITGTKYVWSEEFITLMMIAMSTDSLNQMSSEEKQIWYDWVTFQDLYSFSPIDQDYGGQLAIGCTIPDPVTGLSYAVLEDLSVSAVECIIDGGTIINEGVIASLDAEIMRILNCEPLEDISFTEGDLISISECPVV